MSKKSKSAVQVVSYIMIITLIGKVLGLLRDQMLAWNYGIGMEANAFTAASRIPRVFFDAVFASAVSSSFIPVFNEYMEKEGKERAFLFSSNFISIMGLVTILMSVLGTIFAPQLTNVFVDFSNAQTISLCIQLLKILMPMLFFTGIAFSFVGILQSLDEFTIPAAMSIVSNGIIIIYYLVFSEKFGIFGLAVAFMIGWAMQAIIQIPPLIKKGYHYKFYINLKDEGLKRVGKLMIPVMVSTWIQPINLVINSRFASTLFNDSGSSAIEFANNLYSIISGVFVLSIANIMFPKLSRLIANNNKKEFGETISSILNVLSFLLIPMTFGLMSLSEPIIRLLYEWKEFDSFATELTSRALFFFSIGMIGFGVQTILSRAFYAMKDGRTPLISGIISIAVNLILCLLLINKMNVGGLALASAISAIISAIVLIIPLQKKTKGIINKNMLKNLILIIISAIIMTIFVIIVSNLITGFLGDGIIGRIFNVGVPALVGVIVYMVTTFIMKIDESKFVFDYIRKFIKK